MKDMMTWIVAGVVLAIALIYGLVVPGQMVLFWTIVLAIVVMSIVLFLMYRLNREAERS
jgi:hypothetical protein